MKKLNFSGFAHWIAPALIVAVIGGIGTYMVVGSHADVIYSAKQACGSGYRETNTGAGVYDTQFNPGPADIHILLNSSTHEACAVLMSTGNAYGSPKPMSIHLELFSNNNNAVNKVLVSSKTDSKTYSYYAGPVYLSYAKYLSGYTGSGASRARVYLTAHTGTKMTYHNKVYKADDIDIAMFEVSPR